VAPNLLASGDPCEVVVVQTQALGMQNASGVDLHAMMVTVFVPHKPPYQAQVGNPVPADAVPLLFPGSRLPARISPDDPHAIAVDWPAALADFQ
jgi:hypothetical protein